MHISILEKNAQRVWAAVNSAVVADRAVDPARMRKETPRRKRPSNAQQARQMPGPRLGKVCVVEGNGRFQRKPAQPGGPERPLGALHRDGQTLGVGGLEYPSRGTTEFNFTKLLWSRQRTFVINPTEQVRGPRPDR